MAFRGGAYFAEAARRSEPAIWISNLERCQNEVWFDYQSWRGSLAMTAPFALFESISKANYAYGYRFADIAAEALGAALVEQAVTSVGNGPGRSTTPVREFIV